MKTKKHIVELKKEPWDFTICPNCGDELDWIDGKQFFVCRQCGWKGDFKVTA